MKGSRREFLKSSGCALSMVTLATQMQHFGLMSALAQRVPKTLGSSEPSGGENYKALVLIFWSGGNDGNNVVVPNHESGNSFTYTMYRNARFNQGLAIDQAQLLSISVPRMGGLQFGLHP